MSETEDGFLTEPLDALREEIRQKYSDWRNLLVQTNRIAVAAQHSIEIHRDNNVELFAAALYARTLSTVQASILLLEVGLVPQSRTLLRAAMETLFKLAAIAKDSTVVVNLIKGHDKEKNRVVEHVKRLQHPELKKLVDEEISSGKLDLLISASTGAKSAFDYAKIAELEDWYLMVYMVFSWSTHGAVSDLDRHILKNGDGYITGLCNEPEIEDQESTWSCAIEILLKSATALAAVFPNVDQTPLEHLYADLSEMVMKYQQA